jgi:hypothetical protein
MLDLDVKPAETVLNNKIYVMGLTKIIHNVSNFYKDSIW